MVEVKTPEATDARAISVLLGSLGYPGTKPFIEKRIKQLLSHPDELLRIAVEKGRVIGVISVHFIPQLALEGSFCRISYLCVSEETRGHGVGALLESCAVKEAQQRGCDRIEVHCHSRRTDAHRFYYRHGYADSPKYLCKMRGKV
jgi:GNAT superfamily N-acetyltransferase